VDTQQENDKTQKTARKALENLKSREGTLPDTEMPKPKRKHTLLIVLGSLVALLILVPLFIAAWLGFVPGLSDLLGARTARDLGVTWTQADLASYKSKTSTTFLDFTDAPVSLTDPTKKTIFADPKAAQDLSLSQAEITAAINSLNWELLPVKNVQVRLTKDTIEVSGNLKLDRATDFVRFIGGVGYSESDVQKAVDWGMRFANGAAFYAKGNASVSNNALSFSLQQIQIGRFAVPQDIASKAVYTGGSNGINNTEYLDVKSSSVDTGKLLFTGTYPTTIYVKY
jgi:hypothetical protein